MKSFGITQEDGALMPMPCATSMTKSLQLANSKFQCLSSALTWRITAVSRAYCVVLNLTQKYAGAYPLDGQRGLIIGSVVPSSVRGVKEEYEERPSNIYRRKLWASRIGAERKAGCAIDIMIARRFVVFYVTAVCFKQMKPRPAARLHF